MVGGVVAVVMLRTLNKQNPEPTNTPMPEPRTCYKNRTAILYDAKRNPLSWGFKGDACLPCMYVLRVVALIVSLCVRMCVRACACVCFVLNGGLHVVERADFSTV